MTERRSYWRIVDGIERSIQQGEYSAGTRLPPERELASQYDVGRPTIREAIIALEARGMVSVKTGSGVYVLANQTNKVPQVNAFELTQARALLEGEIAALAAQRITEQELQQLKQTLTDMENQENVEAADEEFHHVIAKSTRNGAMLMSLDNLWALRSSTEEIVNDYNSVCSKDNDKTIAEHTAIYEALVRQDSAEARSAMHAHFARLINALFEASEAQALAELRRTSDEKRDRYSLDNLFH